jgi:hypothetical protein
MVLVLALSPVIVWSAEPPDEDGFVIKTETSDWSHTIVVPVEIDGTEGSYLFMIDTLAPIAIVDPRLRGSMGRRLGKDKYQCPELSVNGSILESAVVRCKDLAALREQTGQDIDGILGAEQLQGLFFRIDVARGRFMTGLPGDVIKGTDFGLEPDRYNIATDFFVGASRNTHSFEADFASRHILTVESKLFESLVAQGEITSYQQGDVDLFHDGVIRRIAIADQVYTEVPVHKGKRNSFGLLLFQNDTLALGASSSEGALMRNTAPRKREWVPWHGLAVSKPAGRITIERIAPRGPAANAGLAPGDVIESINNGPVRYLPVSEVEFHDAWDTGRVEVEYLRNGEKGKAAVIRDKRPDKG